MSPVELRHLATMAAVAEEGSFGRAASRLRYTQSTVSQQIAALEKTVGGAVFERPGGPKPVRLTPLGSVVLAQGRQLLTQADALVDAVDRFKAGEGRIDIGTFQSVSTVVLPMLVRRLRDKHPGCDIRLSEAELEDPHIDGLDLLFYDRPLDGDVEYVKLIDDPYLLVARDGTFGEGPVALERLDGMPMVAWPSTCDQPRMEEALASHGVHPQIVFRTAGNEALLSMVRAGMGPALLPWLALDGTDAWSDDRLRVHQLEPAPPARQIYLYWRAGRTHSPLTRAAIRIAGDIATEISERQTEPYWLSPRPIHMKTTRITLSTLGVLALAACGTGTADNSDGADKPGPEDLKGHTFAIESVEGETRGEKLMKDSKLTIEFAKDGEIKLHTDCNQRFGKVEISGDTIKTDKLAGTLMGCDKTRTDQEDWASKFVESEPEWKLDGKELILTTSDATITLKRSK